MICTKALLLLACLVVVVVHAEDCIIAAYAKLTANKHALNPILVASPDWTIPVPAVPVCPNGYVGLEVTACDDDVAPELRITSVKAVKIIRHGAMKKAAVVNITVDC